MKTDECTNQTLHKMSTTTIFQGFADTYKDQNREIVKKIIEQVPVEKIYLLGLTTNKIRTETMFSVHAPSIRHAIHYYFVVLVQEKENICAIQDKIENNLLHYMPVTAFVFNQEEFKKWLLASHSFAINIKNKAMLLFSIDEDPLPEPASINEQEFQLQQLNVYKAASTRIEEFFAGAELYRIRKQYKMAVFMLHQAAEQALHALLFIKTGYKTNTHNISKLIRYCSMCYPRLNLVFPKDEKSQKLFSLLKDAYIGARYNVDYILTGLELEELTRKVDSIRNFFKESNPSV